MIINDKLRLTAQEMICLNSVAGGGMIPGIRLYKPLIANDKKYMSDTLKMMEIHGFIDEKRQLSTTGILLLRTLQAYKKGDTRIELDGVVIGFEAEVDRSCVYIKKEENHYRMFFHDRAIIFRQMLEKYSFLCQAQENRNAVHVVRRYSEKMEIIRCMKECFPEAEERLEIKKYKEDCLVVHICLCNSEAELRFYDILKKKEQIIGARDARVLLWRLFELEEGKKYVGYN